MDRRSNAGVSGLWAAHNDDFRVGPDHGRFDRYRRELASLCAESGHDVVLVARNAGRLEQAAREIRAAYGVRAVALPMDLAEPGAPERLHAETEERGMSVDFLINNAGFGMSGASSRFPSGSSGR